MGDKFEMCLNEIFFIRIDQESGRAFFTAIPAALSLFSIISFQFVLYKFGLIRAEQNEFSANVKKKQIKFWIGANFLSIAVTIFISLTSILWSLNPLFSLLLLLLTFLFQFILLWVTFLR